MLTPRHPVAISTRPWWSLGGHRGVWGEEDGDILEGGGRHLAVEKVQEESQNEFGKNSLFLSFLSPIITVTARDDVTVTVTQYISDSSVQK